MSLASLLSTRYSVRAFTKTPVPQETLNKVFSSAQLYPSNCNVQPQQVYVVSGEKKEQLKGDLLKVIMTGAKPNPEFNWNPAYQGIHRER